MTFGRRSREIFDSAEAAQLQRDVVATVLHDLGSVTSALALRVDAHTTHLELRDVQAVAALTEQLRSAVKPLVWLRGSPGRGAMAPARLVDVAFWWHHVEQVSLNLLPRGSRLTVVVDAAPPSTPSILPAEQLVLLTMMMLGTCRHLADASPNAPIALAVLLPRSDPPRVRLELSASADGALEQVVGKSTRWRRFCVRSAKRAGATLSWWAPRRDGASAWRWSVTLPDADTLSHKRAVRPLTPATP